jgi:hypothetical protein
MFPECVGENGTATGRERAEFAKPKGTSRHPKRVCQAQANRLHSAYTPGVN